jgi:hypothetical protein
MRKIILVLFCLNLATLSACTQTKIDEKPNPLEQKTLTENSNALVSNKLIEIESFKFKKYLISLIQDGDNCVLKYQIKGVETKLVLNVEAPCNFVRDGGRLKKLPNIVKITKMPKLKANVFTVGGNVAKDEKRCKYGDLETAFFYQVILIKDNEISLGGKRTAWNCLSDGLEGPELYISAEEKP